MSRGAAVSILILVALTLFECGSRDAPGSGPMGVQETTETVSQERIGTGRVIFSVSYVYPSGKVAKTVAVDKMTAYVYEPNGTEVAQANLQKQWVAQASINFADDEELLALAEKAGCSGVFIGIESPTPEGLLELGKKFNLLKGRDFCASVRRIQRHGILVVGSFIIGLDIDEPGIGKRIAKVASRYGVDYLNTLFLTPLPGTRLWDRMKVEDRIALDRFPEDWKYYTLTFPVARYKHLSLDGIIAEMISCDRSFYSVPRVLRRVWGNLWQRRQPLITLLGNLSYRNNLRLNCKAYADFKRYSGNRHNSVRES